MSGQRMSQVIVPKAFTALPADADKRAVVTALAQALVSTKRITPEQLTVVVEETLRRESIGSTGIGNGIAIPHCRAPLTDDILCSYGFCGPGLDFDSLDGAPVHSVFLLLTPPQRKENHLALMKSFASQIRKEHFCEFLAQVKDSKGLVELLAEFENR